MTEDFPAFALLTNSNTRNAMVKEISGVPEFTLAGQESFSCPRHGDVGSTIGVQIELVDYPNIPEALKPYIGRRRYCMACWIDHMDANMEQLSEVPLEGA